jgi:hypothetical protein
MTKQSKEDYVREQLRGLNPITPTAIRYFKEKYEDQVRKLAER